MASPSQAPAVEVIELDNNQAPEAGDPLEPGKIPNQDNEKSPRPNLETEPPLSTDPKGTPAYDTDQAKSKDLDEDLSNLDSDLGGYSDEGATESSNSHATPIQPTRGSKSKKKHREEKALRDITKGTQKTLSTMMSTRSKQGQASKGDSPPQEVLECVTSLGTTEV